MSNRTANGAELEAMINRVAESRDRQAFAALFDHFAPRLKSFMLRGGADPETAEEISEERRLVREPTAPAARDVLVIRGEGRCPGDDPRLTLRHDAGARFARLFERAPIGVVVLDVPR